MGYLFSEMLNFTVIFLNQFLLTSFPREQEQLKIKSSLLEEM